MKFKMLINVNHDHKNYLKGEVYKDANGDYLCMRGYAEKLEMEEKEKSKPAPKAKKGDEGDEKKE